MQRSNFEYHIHYTMLRHLEKHETSNESTNLMYMKQMASINVSRHGRSVESCTDSQKITLKVNVYMHG
jgi:hypothetical protein